MNRRHFVKKAVLLLGSLAVVPPLQASGWKVSSPLPDLGGFGLEGTLPNLKGKVVYLDFWASWCAPCKASFPVLNKWQQEFGAKGFTVFGVSVDETSAEMNAFLKKLGGNFPVVRDAGHKLVAAADVSTMPTAFLIDRKGMIRRVHNGFRDKDAGDLEAQIREMLEER